MGFGSCFLIQTVKQVTSIISEDICCVIGLVMIIVILR